MLRRYIKSNIFCACTMLIVILLSLGIFAQAPLSYGDIVDARDKTLPEEELIKQIEKQKVDFYLHSDDSADLKLNGASDQLIHAITSNVKIKRLPIKFNGWQTFGNIASAPWDKNTTIIFKALMMVQPTM